MRYTAIFFTVFILAACSKNNNPSNDIIKLGNAENLTAIKRNIDTDIFRPSKLFVKDDNLIIYDNVPNLFFKVFDLPAVNYKFSFGNIGQGPGDFISINKENINVSEHFEILSRNKLFYFDVSDTAFTSAKKPLLVISKVDPINNFKKLSDSVYIFNNEDYAKEMKFEFRTFNTHQKTEETFGDILLDNKQEKISDTYQRLNKNFCINRQTGRIAVFYYHYPMFKLLSDKGELLKICTVNCSYDFLTDGFEFQSDKIFFTEAYSTDNYIYVMWVNMDKKEASGNMEKFKPQILVFNWDGELVKQFSSEIPLITFAVSEKYQKIYAVSFREDDINTIYEFSLPQISAVENTKHKQIGNQFYTMEVPDYIDFVTDDDRNQIFPFNGFLMNGNILGDLRETKKELGSIQILYYFIEDEPLTINSIDNFLNKNVVYNSQNITIDNIEVKRFYRTVNTVDYYKNPHILYENLFFFEQNGKIIKIDVTTTTKDAIDSYYNEFLNMIKTFSFL